MLKNSLLLGEWNFTRTVEDDYMNLQRSGSGKLLITSNSWQEQGILDNLSFNQEYFIELTELSLLKYLSKEVLFYKLENILGKYKINHLCNSDLYIGEWNFNGEELLLNWQVSGLRKNYLMQTVYKRV